MYIWAFNDLYIHNYKAVGVTNPTKMLKKDNKRLYKKFMEALNNAGCSQENIEYIDFEG